VNIVALENQLVLHTYTEYVFVALVMQHTVHMRHILICDLCGSNIFFTLSLKRHDLKNVERKMCVLIINVYRSSCKVPVTVYRSSCKVAVTVYRSSCKVPVTVYRSSCKVPVTIVRF
jgi:hypothetical protein